MTSPVEQRVQWVLKRVRTGGDVSVEEIREHFAPSFLGAIPAERVQRVIRDLADRGLESVELEEDPVSPFALRGRGLVGGRAIAIGAQIEREPPHRFVMLLFRPARSIDQIFTETSATDASLPTLVDDFCTPLIEAFAPAGLAIGAIRRGEAAIQGFGAVTTDQIFEIGSVTKPFTGLLLAEMSGRGEVEEENSANAFLPSTAQLPADERGRDISLLDLATHSGSLPRLPPDWEPADPLDPYADFSIQTLYESIAKVVLDAPIGTVVRYSNFGYAILGQVLSLAASKPYEELITERICAPLQMSETGVRVAEKFPERRAQGYGPTGDEVAHWGRLVFAAAGGIETTIGDLTRFLEAQLKPDLTSLETAIRQSQSPRMVSGDRRSVGLAWQIEELSDGTSVIWHSGQSGGFSSSVMFHHRTETGVAAITNRTSNQIDQHCAGLLAQISKSA